MAWKFDRSARLVTVIVDLTGPASTNQFTFGLDTCATHTFVSYEALHVVGYDPDSCPDKESVTTGSNRVLAPVFPVAKLETLDQARENFTITAMKLPFDSSVDGTIGFDFLKDYVLTIDYPKGLIHLEAPPGNPGA